MRPKNVLVIFLLLNALSCKTREKEVVIERIVDRPLITQSANVSEKGLDSKFSEFEGNTGTTERFRSILSNYNCVLTEKTLEGCVIPKDFIELDYAWETLMNFELLIYNHASYKDKDNSVLLSAIREFRGRIEADINYANEMQRLEAEENELGTKLGWRIEHVVSVGLTKRNRASNNFKKIVEDSSLQPRAIKLKPKIFTYRTYGVMHLQNNEFYVGYDVEAKSIVDQIEAVLTKK